MITTRRFALVLCALCLVLGTVPAYADEASSGVSPVAASANTSSPTVASDLVRTFYGQLEDTMKQGDTLGFAGRYTKLEPAIKQAFNLPLMTRFAVGAAWMDASDDQKKSLVDAFTNFSVATYASRFTHYSGEKFEVIGEKPATGGGTMVETHLVPSDGDPVTLTYLVRRDDAGTPRIVDVFLDATISELATRRSEFSAIVRRDGLGSLVTTLGEKAKKMGTT